MLYVNWFTFLLQMLPLSVLPHSFFPWLQVSQYCSRIPAAGFHGVLLSKLVSDVSICFCLGNLWGLWTLLGWLLFPFVCPSRINAIRVKLSKQLPEYWFNKYSQGFKWAVKSSRSKRLEALLCLYSTISTSFPL